MRKLFVAAMAAFVLVGCATIASGDARLPVMYATLKVIDGDAAKAQRVREIATEVKALAADEVFFTVDALIIAINGQIRWEKLDMADTLLVTALVDELRSELTKRFPSTEVDADLRLAVTTVADWVITASSL